MAVTTDILTSPTPRDTLMVTMRVGQGFAQLRRSLGDYTSTYESEESIVNVTVILKPMETYTGTKSNALMISTAAPITLTQVTDSDVPSTSDHVVNRLHFTDELLESFIVTNTGTENVRVGINYSSS